MLEWPHRVLVAGGVATGLKGHGGAGGNGRQTTGTAGVGGAGGSLFGAHGRAGTVLP
ncbi:MAG: hypothetical protein ACLP3C_05870 [Mycobacterium sp.]|uniref:hypothetical protein n=1 Tax=Mycobacterium sp. TaxID=1785 RepID=UPI003F9D6B73